MKRVIIQSKTHGTFSALVDDSDWECVNAHKWHIVKNGKTFYARTYKYQSGKRIQILMHRLIMGIHAKGLVDHIDFNGLNNQRLNLRIVNIRQSNAHRSYGRPVVNGYRGISANPRSKTNPFVARIVVDNKLTYIGSYPNVEAAAMAYNEMALKHHGPEFAMLNKIK